MIQLARSGDLQVAIVWQPEGSRYEVRGSWRIYNFKALKCYHFVSVIYRYA